MACYVKRDVASAESGAEGVVNENILFAGDESRTDSEIFVETDFPCNAVPAESYLY